MRSSHSSSVEKSPDSHTDTLAELYLLESVGFHQLRHYDDDTSTAEAASDAASEKRRLAFVRENLRANRSNREPLKRFDKPTPPAGCKFVSPASPLASRLLVRSTTHGVKHNADGTVERSRNVSEERSAHVKYQRDT